jgi:hypothetical protein
MPIEDSRVLDDAQLNSILNQHVARSDDHDNSNISRFKYLIVFPMGGRTLHEIIDKEWASLSLKKVVVSLIKAVNEAPIKISLDQRTILSKSITVTPG